MFNAVNGDIDECLGESGIEGHEPDADSGEKVLGFSARYEGTCVRCGTSIKLGDLICWSRRPEPSGAYHVACEKIHQEPLPGVPVSPRKTTPMMPSANDEPTTSVLPRPPEERPTTPQQIIKQKGLAPADRADEYLTGRTYETPAGLQLRKHRGQWLRYTGKYYKVLTRETLEVDITNYFNNTAYRSKVTKTFVSSVVQQLTARCLIPERIELPARELNGEWMAEARTVTVMNGTLTMEAGHLGVPPKLRAHSPTLVSRCLLPYDYDPSTQCPAWLEFLEEILPDEGSRTLLQQIFGYCLTADVSRQKFFMFEGTGGNGKGVVTSMLARMVGVENTSSLPLDRFHNQHGLVVTLGKLVNFMSELGQKDKTSEEQLKRATGGDLMYFDPKYQKPFSAKFTAKIIISTNTRPAFADRSNGLWRRLVILRFPVTIAPEKQDPNLEEKLAREMPGMLNWAIQGEISLYRAGRFEEPDESIDARLDFQKESNPARLFLDECCHLDPDGMTATQALYDEYKIYIVERGYKPLNAGNFQSEVLAVPGVTKERVRVGGAKPHVYRGITLTSPKVRMGIGDDHGEV